MVSGAGSGASLTSAERDAEIAALETQLRLIREHNERVQKLRAELAAEQARSLEFSRTGVTGGSGAGTSAASKNDEDPRLLEALAAPITEEPDFAVYAEHLKGTQQSNQRCDKLTERNGATWLESFEKKLQREGLWHIVFERSAVPEEKRASYNCAAKGVLWDSLSPTYQLRVKNTMDVAVMYQRITRSVKSNLQALRERAERDLANLRWENKETAHQFTSKVLDLQERLREAGCPQSEEALKARVFNLLPKGPWHGYLAMVMPAYEDQTKSLFDFLTRVEFIYAQYVSPGSVGGERALVASGEQKSAGASSGGTKKYCTYCKRQGHTLEECYSKKSSEEKGAKKTYVPRCFNCGEQGHLRKECPKPKKKGGGKTSDGQQQQSGDKLAMVMVTKQPQQTGETAATAWQPAKRPAGRYAAAGNDPWDLMLADAFFRELEDETGSFDLEAAADQHGFNARVAQYCTAEPGKRFEETRCAGLHVYGNPPWRSAGKFIEHVRRAHAEDSSTSAVLVLPFTKDAKWWRQLEGWVMLRHWPAGQYVFTLPGKADPTVRRFKLPTPCDVVAMYLPPSDPFAGLATLPRSKVLFDSGASQHMTADRHL